MYAVAQLSAFAAVGLAQPAGVVGTSSLLPVRASATSARAASSSAFAMTGSMRCASFSV